jgi:hypothetical protein
LPLGKSKWKPPRKAASNMGKNPITNFTLYQNNQITRFSENIKKKIPFKDHSLDLPEK